MPVPSTAPCLSDEERMVLPFTIEVILTWLRLQVMIQGTKVILIYCNPKEVTAKVPPSLLHRPVRNLGASLRTPLLSYL